MAYTLEFSRGESTRTKKATSPSPEIIEEIIDELFYVFHHYIVFENEL